MSDGTIEIARLQKNSREVLIVSLQTFKGHKLFTARAWVPNDAGDLIPTKGGLSVRVSLLAELLDVMGQAQARADILGWLDGDEHE